MRVSEIKEIVKKREVEQNLLLGQYDACKNKLEKYNSEILDMIEARNIVSEAARITQQQFKLLVEELVTSAINAVFPNKDYKFVMQFVLQNNRPQINLLVQDGENEPYVPKDEQGGGLLDIISFALRVVLWSLEKPRSRNTLIMDEPFRWTGNLTELAANMMKEISKKLELQIIMVTHDERLMEIADKSWLCKKEKELSVVKE
jgi:DNA repair exonuclease SbcCD ATPase subunit